MTGDPVRLRQCLFNLLSNAAKFTENGAITVTVEPRETAGREWLAFNVRDTGIGMTPEQVNRVFDAFSQADIHISAKYGGTGLGLAIVRELCALMGGEIDIESAPGNGSSFTLRLPLRGEASDILPDRFARTDVQRTAPDPSDNHLPWALVIDDEPPARVILLDIIMPEMDGWEVLAKLKADPALASIPVIVCTVLEDRENSLALGADEFLLKPIQYERLRAALARLLRQPLEIRP